MRPRELAIYDSILGQMIFVDRVQLIGDVEYICTLYSSSTDRGSASSSIGDWTYLNWGLYVDYLGIRCSSIEDRE